jgi:hypothetical protein
MAKSQNLVSRNAATRQRNQNPEIGFQGLAQGFIGFDVAASREADFA